jgi:hypothetical protein
MWSTDNINALAPDPETANRGKKLASLSKWQSVGSFEAALWGECKGSGAEPYFVMIDMEGPAYNCSCPVRQMPCKHAMGLFFLYAEKAVAENPKLPAKVEEWMTKRSSKKEKFAAPQVELIVNAEEKQKAKEKRVQERTELMSSGIEELDLWLKDLVRQGLANVGFANSKFWENAAAKFKDAKLSKVAYSIRELGENSAKSVDSSQETAMGIGELSLLVSAFRNLPQLDEDMQEEIFNTIGRIVKKSDVLERGTSVKDKWLVLAENETFSLDYIQERRVWLQGIESKKTAMIQDFLFPGANSYEQQFLVGSILDAELAFYPASFQQRAIIKYSSLFELQGADFVAEFVAEFVDFSELMTAYANMLKINPWLRLASVSIADLIPFKDTKGNWFVMDRFKQILKLNNPSHDSLIKILSMSGGHPIAMIGEYNGSGLEVLSVFCGGRFTAI